MKIVIPALLLLLSTLCHAHKPSDSYLTVIAAPQQASAQLDLALRDLDFAIGLDADNDGHIRWGELREARTRISSYAFSRLDIGRGGQNCPMRLQQLMVNEHVDGRYATLMLALDCPAATGNDTFTFSYRLLFDVDRLHRSIVSLRHGETTRTAVIAADDAALSLSTVTDSGWQQWLGFVWQGIWHIWIGYDHILFLLSLLLPAVMSLHGRQWQAATRFGPVLRDTAAIVTAFTIAHSITLSLAAFELVQLPTRLVESAIALSVIIVALNNIVPVIHGRRWLVAFVFGLIHGFGFASVLGDLGLGSASLLSTVSGFNIGVEIGQLAIVAVVLPLAYRLRTTRIYLHLGLRGASAAIALLAAVWLAERALNLQLLPVSGT